MSPVVREAEPRDFDGVMRLYAALNPDDPRPDVKAAHATFEQILARPGLHLLVLELDGSRTPATHAFYRACGFSPDAKQAYLARRPSD